jgi:hypothetical protein
MEVHMTELRISYNYCAICGRQPQTKLDEPNYGPIKFWDPDDGWKISTLCRWCKDEYGDRQPQPDDFAYEDEYGSSHISIETDEDPLIALEIEAERRSPGILAQIAAKHYGDQS